MFQNISKIVIKPKKCKKAESIIVVSQRMQCRTTHKRKDC